MRRLVLLGGALLLAACSPAADKTGGGAQSETFHKQVVAYLADRPEVIQEGINAYQAKQRDAAQLKAAQVIAQRRGDVEHDPRDYVANPQGKVTVTEFFDYRCPYCKAALPKIQELIKANRDVRFVFKEMPILPDADGQIGTSLRASRAALAAQRAGKYQAVHDAMMAAHPLDDVGIVQALQASGLDPATALAANTDDTNHIQSVRDLAQAIGATGTPTFIVGTTMIEGNSMDRLTAAIAEARKAAKS
jgi:protein-disulfide isomerase